VERRAARGRGTEYPSFQQDRAREPQDLQDLLATIERDPTTEDNGVTTLAVREAHALHQALDRVARLRALEARP
jgi:hypothetical protein